MFSRATFRFLDELAANNNRAWFEANKARYEAEVRGPALDFIDSMAPALASFAPEFRADARKMGGSLMRVFRDTRFSNDKTPYKTNIGIQFRHTLGKDVHAPGFYVHIATDECFVGAGCWHPASDALARIRTHIAQEPTQWFAARDALQKSDWNLVGDSLTRPPRGFATDHPAITDLKRKDFMGLIAVPRKDLLAANFVDTAAQKFTTSVPLVRYLCTALDVMY
jgi:uncharacterized protein (TIGR02453 family)